MRRKRKRPAGAPVMISFIGESGAGKTGLLERLIAELTSRGFRTGAVKHSRAAFQLDTGGKDSDRLKKAGARKVLLAGPRSIGMVADRDGDLSPADIAGRFFDDTDIVLVEGWKESDLPKIHVTGPAPPPPGVTNIVAEVGRRGMIAGLPLFPPDEVGRLADFILSFGHLD